MILARFSEARWQIHQAKVLKALHEKITYGVEMKQGNCWHLYMLPLGFYFVLFFEVDNSRAVMVASCLVGIMRKEKL